MKTVKLRYVVKKRGKLFWQPHPRMHALGFLPKPLGPDGPAAQAEAFRLFNEWIKYEAGQEPQVSTYPAGSFGEYWDSFRTTATWEDKSPRTREDYERAWVFLDKWRPSEKEPTFACTPCSQITTELCERFYKHMDKTTSPNERHRTVKWMKVLVNDMIVRLRFPYASPASKLVNPQPKGRTAIWLYHEIEDLSATAAIAGFECMSLAIETFWETMFSPVDVRELRPRQIRRDTGGWYIEGHRGKTKRAFFAAISDNLAERLLALIKNQNRAEVDDTPVFRTRTMEVGSGRPRPPVPYDKDLFSKDFRLVRDILFPDDTRQLLDIRRSANVEADASGADKKTMGELLANGLADNKFLEETYTPATVTKAREVAQQRLVGRAKLAQEMIRIRSNSIGKV